MTKSEKFAKAIKEALATVEQHRALYWKLCHKYTTKSANETTTFPEHLIFIARTCGTYLLFKNKNSADIIINYYQNKLGTHYFIFNTKKDIPYKEVHWKKALEYTKEYPKEEKQHA